MQLIVTGKNMDVSDRMRDYVEKRIGKLGRYLEDSAELRVEFSNESVRSATLRQVVQLTCLNNGSVFRSEERAADLTAAIDAVVDKLDRQIKRHKDKRVSRKRRAQPQEGLVALAEPAVEEEQLVVRVKRFRTSPMTEEDAIEQMENLGHTFFGFFNRDTGELNVVYKRLDGNYGRLEYEVV